MGQHPPQHPAGPMDADLDGRRGESQPGGDLLVTPLGGSQAQHLLISPGHPAHAIFEDLPDFMECVDLLRRLVGRG